VSLLKVERPLRAKSISWIDLSEERPPLRTIELACTACVTVVLAAQNEVTIRATSGIDHRDNREGKNGI
jgi:hypothetical protein